MSCSGKLPVLRALAARSYSSAQAKPAPTSRPSGKIATTVLPNKVLVAAYDNGSPLARLTVAYKAGSRNEPADEPGLTHVLRVAAGLSTSGASGFAITRNLQQFGANLTATADRETIYYTLEASRIHLEDAVRFLNDVASRPTFKPWELDELSNRIKYEIVGLPSQVRALDLLHKAAYRRGLGNSLFCPPRRIGKVSAESLQHFVSSNFTGERCAVSSVGISLDRTVALAQTLSLNQGSNSVVPSPYKGGENRKEMGGDLAHVAIAVEGAALANSKDALALAILSRAVGNGPVTSRGADNNAAAKAIGKELGDAPFAARGFSLSYSDTGLFGILLSTSGDNAGKATQAAGKLLKSGITSIGADALKRARAVLQAEILCAGDTSSVLVSGMATQGLLTGAVITPAEAADSVGKITDSDISSLAGKISRGKISMGAAGAIVNVPYADEIQ